MKTCNDCEFFQLFHGESRGECFALPPQALASGVTMGRPQVKALTRYCSLFRPRNTPEPVEKVKVNPPRPERRKNT